MSDPATDEIMSRLSASIESAMEEIAGDIADDLRETLSGPSPSSPGNPPGLKSGRLKGSVEVLPEIEVGSASGQLPSVSVSIRTDTPYDEFLEKGTSKMAARPFAAPIEAKWEPIVTNRLTVAASLSNT